MITCLYLYLCLFASFPSSFITLIQREKVLVYEDASYEPEIRTVLLYPYSGSEADTNEPPVTPLASQRMILEFDDLVDAPEDYRVRIIPCNSNWRPNRLRTMDFLDDYNEFNINDHELSIDTRLAYVHYTFTLPRLKRPGNYLLVTYRGTDEDDIILSKRFMVAGEGITVQVMSSLNGLTSISRENQQIDFTVQYNDLDIKNPADQISVVIRQNQRWDNALFTLKPNAIRDFDKELEYRFFNETNNFPAGSEYRFFDMRSLRYPGQNVAFVNRESRPITVVLGKDKSRGAEAYSRVEDLNGNFIIANSDTGNGRVESDYVTVRFTLMSEEKIPGKVYVVGKMNNYHLTTDNEMIYDAGSKSYQGAQIIKQGWYNYKYEVKGDSTDPNIFEGSHYETDNDYEIFVYLHPLDKKGDLLMGYKQVTLNDYR